MNDVQEMLQKRAALMDTANNLQKKAFDEKGEIVSRKDYKDFMKVLAKVNGLTELINEQASSYGVPELELITTLEDFERAYDELDEPINPVRPPGMSNPLPQSSHGRQRALMPGEKKSYQNLFCDGRDVPLDRGGFRDFNEYLSILHSGMSDERFIKSAAIRGMVEGVGESGGFIVPEEFGAFLWDSSLENEIVRPRAMVWPMGAPTRRVPAWNNFDHSEGAVYGGITGKWLGETEDAGDEVEPKLRELTLQVKRLACYAKVSDALLADSQIDSLLSVALIKGLGWYLDLAFFHGDGVAKPLGVFNDPALITVPRATANKIQYIDLCNMFARMAPACLNRAVWVANQSAIPQLLTLTVETGTDTGEHVPALREDGRGGFTLLTKPVIFTEKVPALGNKGDIGLYDFSQYAIGMRKELAIDRSNAVYWKTSETAYRVIGRVDGQGTWNEPLKPKNGDPVSWCVVLDT